KDLSKAPVASATPSAQVQPSAASFEQMVDRVAASEQQFLKTVYGYTPLTETYIQNMKPDPDLGQRPASDAYFMGKLELTPTGARDRSFLPKPGFFTAAFEKLTVLFNMKYLPLGFAQMITPDNGGLNRQNYDFTF